MRRNLPLHGLQAASRSGCWPGLRLLLFFGCCVAAAGAVLFPDTATWAYFSAVKAEQMQISVANWTAGADLQARLEVFSPGGLAAPALPGAAVLAALDPAPPAREFAACVFNTGDQATEQLTIHPVLTLIGDSLAPVDLENFWIGPDSTGQVQPGETRCFPFSFQTRLEPSRLYRISVKITISNHTGWQPNSVRCQQSAPCLYGPETTLDFAFNDPLPTPEPTVPPAPEPSVLPPLPSEIPPTQPPPATPLPADPTQPVELPTQPVEPTAGVEETDAATEAAPQPVEEPSETPVPTDPPPSDTQVPVEPSPVPSDAPTDLPPAAGAETPAPSGA